MRISPWFGRALFGLLCLLPAPGNASAAPDPALSSCDFPEYLPAVQQELTIAVVIRDANGPIVGMAVSLSIAVESGTLAADQPLQTSAWSNIEGRALLKFDGIRGDATVHLVSEAGGVVLCTSPSYRVFTGPKLGLHVQPVTGLACSSQPIDYPCSAYNTAGGLRSAYHVYLVAAQAEYRDDLRAPANEGVLGFTCGIRYGSGLSNVSWTTCASAEVEFFGDWPASGGGLQLVWNQRPRECPGTVVPDQGLHAVAGAFYVYSYDDDLLEITANTNSGGYLDGLSYYTCELQRLEFPEHAIAKARFSEAGNIPGYNPCPGTPTLPLPPPPPPPPPPPWGERTALILHIGAVTDTAVACVSGPRAANDVVTQASASVDGSANYFVYLLGAPSDSSDTQPLGLNGMQLGIDYNQDTPERRGLLVESWHACSDLDFPGDDWPAPRSGNTITWSLGNCQQSPMVVAGYFYVTAYGASVMSLAPFPPTGVVKAADCGGAEFVLNKVLNTSAVGWISLGGGRIGPDQDGCNPALESCERSTPAVPTTWGRLKQQYRN